MIIEIKLKNQDLCDGCPLLELDNGGWSYYSKCKHPKHYKIERISLTNWEVWLKYGQSGSNHLDLIGRFETPRNKNCKNQEKVNVIL